MHYRIGPNEIMSITLKPETMKRWAFRGTPAVGSFKCWVRFISQHETLCDSEIVIKDADHQRKIIKERNSEAYWRIRVKPNEDEHGKHYLL